MTTTRPESELDDTSALCAAKRPIAVATKQKTVRDKVLAKRLRLCDLLLGSNDSISFIVLKFLNPARNFVRSDCNKALKHQPPS
jgi:hypothetical protein